MFSGPLKSSIGNYDMQKCQICTPPLAVPKSPTWELRMGLCPWAGVDTFLRGFLDPEKTPKIPGTFIFTQPSSLGVTPDPSKTLQKRPQNHTKNDPKFRSPRRKLLCFGVVSLKTHFFRFFQVFENLKKVKNLSNFCQKFIKILMFLTHF